MARLARLHQTRLEKLAAIPGIRAVGYPLAACSSATKRAVLLPSRAKAGRRNRISNRPVGPVYFALVRIPVLLRREIGPQNNDDGNPAPFRVEFFIVLDHPIVNATFANQSPLNTEGSVQLQSMPLRSIHRRFSLV